MQDVIIIGSGFGGSIAASRLIDAGVRVTLLERGPWRDSEPTRSLGISSRAPFAQGWNLYTHGLRSLHLPFLPKQGLTVNKKGLFEFFYSKGLWMLCASGVGGGSHVYGGLHQRPLRADFWDGHCEGLSSEIMESHYQSVMQRFGSRLPTEADHIPNMAREVFRDSTLLTADNPTVQPACGLLMPEEPGKPKPVVTPEGIRRHEARWDAMHILGSEDGAKSTLDFVYLAEAMQKGLKVLDLHEAKLIRRVRVNGETGYEIDVRDHHYGRNRTLRAKQVFLAAGTMNTLKLLFASRVAGGLHGMPHLGKRLGSNGDTFSAWRVPDPRRDNTAGFVSGVDFRENPTGLFLAYAPVAGIKHLKLPARLKRHLARFGSFTGMGEDAADGTVSYANGRLQVDYDSGNSPIFAQFHEAFRRIEAGTGNRVYTLKTPLTVHQCGGACVAQTIEEGVIGVNGEVFDNPGIYVSDSTGLPGPVGGPPSMSVAAWSSFVAEQFLAASGATSADKHAAA